MTPVQWAFGALLFGGLIALVVGMILQFTVGGPSIAIAGGIFVLSRLAMGTIRVLQPKAFQGKTPGKAASVILLIGWILISIVLVKVGLNYL